MTQSNDYGPVTVIVSLVAVIVVTAHLFHAIRQYHKYRDERAGRSLLVSLTLWVVALGVLISGSGLISGGMQTAAIGLSIVRGALVVGGVALLLADRQEK